MLLLSIKKVIYSFIMFIACNSTRAILTTFHARNKAFMLLFYGVIGETTNAAKDIGNHLQTFKKSNFLIFHKGSSYEL